MTDIYYDNTSLVLLCDPGENYPGGMRAFQDSSLLRTTVSTNGDTTLSAAQSKHGGYSGYFDGNADYLSIPSNAGLNFGTNDFTVEAWIRPTSLTNAPFLFAKLASWNTANDGWFIELGPSNVWFGHGILAGNYKAFSTTLNNDTWYHVACTRVGSSLTVFVNGVSLGSQTLASAASSYDNSAQAVIASTRTLNTSFDYAGYIDDFRVTKGIARYTGNFTPPEDFSGDYPIPPWQCRLLTTVTSGASQTLKASLYYGGTGTITGTVKVGTTAVKRRVRLYEAATGILVQEKWTDSNGNYSFIGVKTEYKYTVTAVDCTGTYNDVIAANITPV